VFEACSPVNGSVNQPLSLAWSISILILRVICLIGRFSVVMVRAIVVRVQVMRRSRLSLSGLAYSTTYTVWVNATDLSGSGLSTGAWYTFTTKANLPPVFGSPTPANRSTSQPLSFTWRIPINDLEGDQFSWTIECSNGDKNNESLASNGMKSLNLSRLTYSTKYTIWVNATDPTGSNQFTRKWYTITTQSTGSGSSSGGGGSPPSAPENKKPVANTSAGEPYQGYVNAEITFDGSKSYDPDGNITQWFWEFGDNSNGSGEIVQHIYSKAGTYTITLVVTDNEGATNTTTTSCVIIQPNRPPTKPTITGTIFGTTNTTYMYTAFSTDPDNDSIMYTFDWDDSVSQSSEFVPSGTSIAMNHSWTTPGQYTLTVTVTDNQTESSSQIVITIEAEIKNQPSTPGFELFYIIGAIAISILIWKKKRNR
jgi:PKD repeat protein